MTLGIDVGGTKTLVAVLDDSGQIAEKQRFETPENYSDFILKLEETVKKLTTNFTVCVTALPGLLNRSSGIGIAFGNRTWENVPFKDDAGEFIGCPIYIENDAKLAGLSESQYVLNTYKKVLYLTISTGIGGALLVNGRLDQDVLDAEPGHMLLEHEGKLQPWEDFASGRAIVTRTGRLASDITDPNEWEIIARNIALGLTNVVANLAPDCVIIGGGVGTHLDKFHPQLEKYLKEFSDNMIKVPPVLKAQHAEEAVLYGCYVYATQL